MAEIEPRAHIKIWTILDQCSNVLLAFLARDHPFSVAVPSPLPQRDSPF